MSYDNFAETFSKSRIEHPWPELDYLIDIMCQKGSTSILDVGCGNGRFIEHYESWVTNHELQYLGIDSSTGMIREARRLHPGYEFEVYPMCSFSNHESWITNYDCILFLASFHHLETREERLQVLQNMKLYLAQCGEIMMTNWNLRDQPRYAKSHRWNGDYDIKIGAFSRYYHGFTLDELEWLFVEAGYQIVENRVFEGGRNIVSRIII